MAKTTKKGGAVKKPTPKKTLKNPVRRTRPKGEAAPSGTARPLRSRPEAGAKTEGGRVGHSLPQEEAAKPLDGEVGNEVAETPLPESEAKGREVEDDKRLDEASPPNEETGDEYLDEDDDDDLEEDDDDFEDDEDDEDYDDEDEE